MLSILNWMVIGAALVLSAAIFGFFYAWVCSTMWGLDAADPRVAIAAMQAMNASVRNVVFAPAFFGTPIVLLLAGVLLWGQGHQASGGTFIASGLVYALGGMILTMMVNVPMNEALALQDIPSDPADAQAMWDAYSPRWQVWNQTRTVLSGVSFVIALAGVVQFARVGQASSSLLAN